ncbi:MAG: amidase family protein, partial [Deltaproteobacteria bacterium]
LAGPPPEIGELIPDEDDPAGKSDKIFSLIPYTPAFNATGQPAISLPLAVWENSGLPLGIQLVGDYGREDLLLGVSAQLEEARPWAGRRPALFG